MKVLEMPEQFGGEMRSIGELIALASYEGSCYSRRKKKKCGGELCKNCPYGEAHRLKGALDPYQRVWVDYQVEKQEAACRVTAEDVADFIGDAMGLLIPAALFGAFVWFIWWMFTR